MSNTNHVLTLANCIIGVSVLTMPFCFKQCGIALAILMLYLSSLITKLSCHYLLKSAIMEKIKNFEMLGFRAFGPSGKTMVELCIIFLMLGSCVAFFVIMGDLGPTIIGPALGIEHVTALRPSVLIAIAVLVILPLGLLKNVDSLSSICTASTIFYMFLVLKVFAEAAGNLVTGNWLYDVIWWRPSGVLQCIPIFSMALSCQTQLFEIFDTLPNVQLDRTNAVVRTAINMTTIFYIAVGFFGYTAYYNQSFSGNLMLSFSPSLISQVMKMGFLLSIAVSFPLVLFPCRASIYSFFYSKVQYGYEGIHTSHIPETTFQCITLAIITFSLVLGLVLPEIEVVLGLVGSTIGVFVCLIIPGMIFNALSSRKNNEKLAAQCLVGIGLIIMILSTYTNLFATEEKIAKPIIEHLDKKELQEFPQKNIDDLNVEKVIRKIEELKPVKGPAPEPVQPEPPKDLKVEELKTAKIEPKAEPKIEPKAPKIEVKEDTLKLQISEVKKPDPVQPEPPKEPEISKETLKIDLNPIKENITANMANGVPLPIIKIVKDEKKVKEREKREAELDCPEENVQEKSDCPKTDSPEIVKAPRHLTDEKIVLDTSIKMPEPHLDIASPQKRDLKSLANKKH